MSTAVTVSVLPSCDLCKFLDNVEKPAEYDFRTTDGRWANGCEPHYVEHRMYSTLGTGKGQKLIVAPAPREGD